MEIYVRTTRKWSNLLYTNWRIKMYAAMIQDLLVAVSTGIVGLFVIIKLIVGWIL